jgi:alanine dehydrogenase
MIIGVPKEIKNNENRIGLTPSSVQELTRRGHTVYVQAGGGQCSGFGDEDYRSAGAAMLDNIKEVYAQSEMIVKVKEPIAEEYELIRNGQLVFTYFHFASSEELTRAMIDRGGICLAYETVELKDGTLPLLMPMSEVAGRMAVQEGAKYLERPMGGRGVLLGGVPGTPRAKVLILGGGVVGSQSARMAAGLGADVTILDVSLPRMRYLDEVMPANVHTMMSNERNIEELARNADLVVGAVLVPGAKAPRLITRETLKIMQSGSVVVDVAVDQGGCIETCHPTTHQAPTFVVEDVVHYCVANMPGAVPYTSTIALNNATLPYTIQLADKGWQQACRESEPLRRGLNIVDGEVVYQAVADAFDLSYKPVDALMPV